MNQPSPTNQPIDLSGLKLHSIHDREHLSQIDSFAKTPDAGVSFSDWFASLPGFLGAKRLHSAVDAIVAARKANKPVGFAMGGHLQGELIIPCARLRLNKIDVRLKCTNPVRHGGHKLRFYISRLTLGGL